MYKRYIFVIFELDMVLFRVFLEYKFGESEGKVEGVVVIYLVFNNLI